MPLYIDIKVTPRAKKQQWTWDKSGTLKCSLKSPAEKGKANAELVRAVADALGVSQSDVHIHLGELSRHKVLRIDKEITREQFIRAVGLENGQRDIKDQKDKGQLDIFD